MSILYIVSTPIGHLGDLTHRAVAVLSTVDRVLAEDTRHTAVLFRRYGIATPLVSAHAHNEEARAARILAWLDAGETLAIVSDAGTPLLSDPGARIVRRVVAGGHRVEAVPGASALLAALVVSGLPPEPFTFRGFLPRRGEAREEALREVAACAHTTVLYESPRRLADLLRDLARHCGQGRPAAVARELTKLHEEVVRGTLADTVAYYGDGPARGEIVVVVGGVTPAERAVEAEAAEAAAVALVSRLLESGARPSVVARTVAKETGLARNDAYRIALSLSQEAEGEGS